tara:strand:+ start:44 stop:184 length:141 start_codon:yes stop_codon:yes gene_type:complete
MLIMVRVDLTEEGENNKSQVLEEVDYLFKHEWIISTEIVDVITEEN